MKRILFVHNHPQRFVVIDRDLLSERWQIQEQHEQRGKTNPALIARAVRQSDLVFAWFASWHSLLPVLFARLFGKPSVVVIGGYDTANLPIAGYGSQRGGLRRLVSRAVIANATHLITNSYSARREAIANANADPGRTSVIYHGVDAFPMGSLTDRERTVLTVGNVSRENLLRKGLLPFIQAARYLPDVRFALVGKWLDDGVEILRAEAGENVQLLGFLPDSVLQSRYMHASIYVQASLHEGFGLSVAEAMTAGCIPVVTPIGSLPEVVGDTGVYADSNSPADVASAIRQALKLDGTHRQRARQRVLSRFPISARRYMMHTLVEKLLLRAEMPKAQRSVRIDLPQPWETVMELDQAE